VPGAGSAWAGVAGADAARVVHTEHSRTSAEGFLTTLLGVNTVFAMAAMAAVCFKAQQSVGILPATVHWSLQHYTWQIEHSNLILKA